MEGRIPGQDGVAGTKRPTMTRARFSIGIDLGTTNCALAFVPLHGEARSEILGIPQWETISGITESPALPSFLYLPDEAVAAQMDGWTRDLAMLAGRLATISFHHHLPRFTELN